MGLQALDNPDGRSEAQLFEQVLGYLNFSSGSPDTQYLASLDQLFRIARPSAAEQPVWRRVVSRLENKLTEFEENSSTFSDALQARRVLQLLVSFGPAYMEYHHDLLAHQESGDMFNSFFIGRVTECLLASNPLSDDPSAVLQRTIHRLNDYVGYRPVAALESRKIEPYEHEWVRPVPVYVKGAGVADGPYQEIVTECIRLLHDTDPQLLRQAYFDPDRLDELAIDPRAYDFDHPANKRPNHHFGQWDPHLIDGDGFYRRFVVQQVTIDALLRRAREVTEISHAELMMEAAAVLTGTILMSSGISGFGPETHSSSMSLAELLISIAAYRDEFYRQLLQKTPGSHGARLVEEATRLQQPFAAARQDLNRQLTECRALQLQRVQLAKIFARMNYSEEALQQTDSIQVPAARIACQIDCQLSQARAAMQEAELAVALSRIESARADLLRGIGCGAIVDPWNILGFDANFSLFGSVENSLRDYRIDDLIDVIEEMLELYAQLWSKAAATQQPEIVVQVSQKFEAFANWWHQFAAHEMDSVVAEDPLEVHHAAKNVAEALHAWHQTGEASGDIGFWAPHVQKFDSCRAYWLVVNTLLSRDDKVAALGLLMHWLSNSDHIPLEQGEASFYRLSLRWLGAALAETGTLPVSPERVGWKRIRRFFDYLEANAGEFWEVPRFDPEEGTHGDRRDELDEEDEEDTFGAAYENVVYRDSTDDDMDASIFDFDTTNNDEDYLQQVSRVIVGRIQFIEQLAAIWKLLAVTWSTAIAQRSPDAIEKKTAGLMHELFCNARDHLMKTWQDLSELMESVAQYRLARPGTNPESLIHYDRLRLLKDSLIDQTMNAHVSVTQGLQFLSAAVDGAGGSQSKPPEEHLLQACLRGDQRQAARLWPKVREELRKKAILYVPLNRGGAPAAIAEVRARQQLIQDLMFWMPRIGLLTESYQLIELVRVMELTPVGIGAITEFDDLFEVGCRSAVDALVDARDPAKPESRPPNDWLVHQLEEMMEPLLRNWLAHSRTLRLSVLEQVLDESAWSELVKFIQDYGRDLFTQRFLNLGNVRGILHQGVEHWLRQLETRETDDYASILDALEHGLERDQLVEKLSLILEAIVENYAEYRDYNSTTTQSDRGDLLYTLLDFLRVRVSYDRIVWNLRPVVLAHQVLAIRNCEEAAAQWRSNLEDRIRGEAKRHMARLQELQHKYAMRLPSISKRISERFMRPLMIDYLCALVQPAMADEDQAARKTAFERIQHQAEVFLSEPSGAGLDIPTWLIAMEDAVRMQHDKHEASFLHLMEQQMLPPAHLSIEQVQVIVESWRDEVDS